MSHNTAQGLIEKRREARCMADGEVRIVLEEPVEVEILGHLVDVSRSGFRAAHLHTTLTKGETVRFEHPTASGHARVVWNRIDGRSVETGFLIL